MSTISMQSTMMEKNIIKQNNDRKVHIIKD